MGVVKRTAHLQGKFVVQKVIGHLYISAVQKGFSTEFIDVC